MQCWFLIVLMDDIKLKRISNDLLPIKLCKKLFRILLIKYEKIQEKPFLKTVCQMILLLLAVKQDLKLEKAAEKRVECNQLVHVEMCKQVITFLMFSPKTTSHVLAY